MKLARATGEYQTWLRIRLSIAAFAYEFDATSIISDAEFDKLCLEVDTSIATARPDLDKWFKRNFNSATGMWIRGHPELKKIEALYTKHWRGTGVHKSSGDIQN